MAAEAPEPEVLTTEDLYARRPRKCAAAPAAEAEAAPVEDESKEGSSNAHRTRAHAAHGPSR
ncbi:MAG: hypothetical protein ACLTSX_09640 [Collinsella sp.]